MDDDIARPDGTVRKRSEREGLIIRQIPSYTFQSFINCASTYFRKKQWILNLQFLFFYFIIFIKHKEQRKLQNQEQLQSIPIAGMKKQKQKQKTNKQTNKKSKTKQQQQQNGGKERLYHCIAFQETSCLALMIEQEDMSTNLVFQIRKFHGQLDIF